jgi:arylsulfatase A-like enzyme
MPRDPGFRPATISLWFRFTTLGIIALVFAEALFLGRARVQGWTFYLSGSEVVFEVAVRLIVTALLGILVGTVFTLVLIPFLLVFDPSRVAERATAVALALVLFFDSRYALVTLLKWAHVRERLSAALLALYLVVFVIGLCVPRVRKEMFSTLNPFLGRRVTRLTALATLIALLGLIGAEFALARRHSEQAALPTPGKSANYLLISFDAFSAEDMSLYGYKLPTTPNLDAFARTGTVFTNFYAASTFTTPCIGVMLTGGYPSETHLYGLAGQVPDEYADKSLPAMMRAGGYATGAFLTNPWAYYLARSLKEGFARLPEPVFHPGLMQFLWKLTSPLHQDSRVGSRIAEYFDLENELDSLQGKDESPAFRYRPDASFAHTREMLADLPDGFFLWVHLVAPHHPYLPDPADQGRYIPEAELQSFKEEPWPLWKPHYDPAVQDQVDRRRLAYDEYILTTDRAFGQFMKELENSGRLNNTTVIVSADHGESFEGGVYQHQTPYLTRPVIHIPLIIKTPGQHVGRTVGVAADQTALAPTILDLAGLSRPPWMHGESLSPWLKSANPTKGSGMAFTEYLEKNSVFRPLHHGSLGVIDGEYQYVFDLGNEAGTLRPLNRAQQWDLDVAAENPQKASALRSALHAKFPGIVPQN